MEIDMKSTNVTAKNFGRKLSGVVSSAKTMRGNIQNLMLFGMEWYLEHGDTGYLDRCMDACVGVKTLPTQKCKQFIQEHANVTWREVEIKSGKNKGKKVSVFKKRGKEPSYKEPTTNWWDISNAGQATPDLDTDARILSFIKAIDKNLETGKVKDVEHARKTRHELAKLADTLHIAITA